MQKSKEMRSPGNGIQPYNPKLLKFYNLLIMN